MDEQLRCDMVVSTVAFGAISGVCLHTHLGWLISILAGAVFGILLAISLNLLNDITGKDQTSSPDKD